MNIPMELSSVEMDVLTAVEGECKLPIAFKTKDDLSKWMEDNILSYKKIGNFSDRNAARVDGEIYAGFNQIKYSQTWVRAKYNGYRKACTRYLREAENFTGPMDKHDVDHAVSRRYLTKHWPDAWVNAVWVENGINRSIGAMLEKNLRPPTNSVVHVNIEFLLKMFYRKKGKMSFSRIDTYFKEACSRFLSEVKSIDDLDAVMSADRLLNNIAEEAGLPPPRPNRVIAISYLR